MPLFGKMSTRSHSGINHPSCSHVGKHFIVCILFFVSSMSEHTFPVCFSRNIVKPNVTWIKRRDILLRNLWNKQSRINMMSAFASSNYSFWNPANGPVTASRNEKKKCFRNSKKSKLISILKDLQEENKWSDGKSFELIVASSRNERW